MSSQLETSKNPYASKNPFSVLDAKRNASPRELDDAMEQLLEDLEYASLEDEERQQKRQEIMQAYDELRDARSRMAVEFFFFDATEDQQECKKAAAKYKTIEFDFSRILHGAEDVFPSSPEFGDKQLARRKVNLRESIRLADASEKYRPAPEVEALKTITFDR